MTLRCITQQVWDVTATEQAIAYAKKDTKADGSVFASFHLCDWETLQSRPIAEAAYLQMKFGEVGSFVAEALGEVFSCRAARLPDGGCAVLRSDALLDLYRPDGRLGAEFFLGYRQAPAYDIACDGAGLWFTVPARDAVVLLSLQTREMELRVGGPNVFPQPLGIVRAGNELFISCAATRQVKALTLPDYELGEAFTLTAPPEKYFRVFGKAFVWLGSGLFAVEN